MAAAGPPLDLYPLAWFGLVPLFIALQGSRSGGFWIGFTAGVAFNAGTLYWLAFNTGTYLLVAMLTMVAAVLVLAVGWGTGAWLWCRVRDRLGGAAWVVVPFAWTAWEGWLSYLGELGFPWPLLALTQSGFEPVLQVMEFTGVWGVSFWVAALNAAIFIIWRGSRRRARRIAFAVFVLLVIVPPAALWHAYSYCRERLPTARVLVVQGNVPASEKWLRGAAPSWATYDSLTRDGATIGVDLVVWPETALPANLVHQSIYADKLTLLAGELEAAILAGASDYNRVDGKLRPMNAAFLVRPGEGIVDRYAKRQLVPFGERVPFQRLMPRLGELNLGQAEFLPGLRPAVFEVPTGAATARFPAMVCYESAFPSQSRELVRRGANLLATISNDAWYGVSSEPYQIAALSRFRCIETRRAMARASNTGISFLADHLGREITRTKLFEGNWIAAEVPLCTATTFYTAYGDLFLALVTAVYGISLLAAAVVTSHEGEETKFILTQGRKDAEE